jgi:hypothetical protein
MRNPSPKLYSASDQAQNTLKKLFLRRVPQNVTIVGEIEEFHFPQDSMAKSEFKLKNGTVRLFI